MKKFLFVFVLAAFAATLHAQGKYFTRDAKIQFYSDAQLEKIEAVNKSGTAVLDASSGKMEWKALIKNFLFEKALMQEHFNENYMESDKYPSATFKGQIADMSKVNFGTPGTYNINVKGKMSMHGVEKDIEVPGKVVVGGGNIKLQATFDIMCSDYNVKIEAQKVSNIANKITINVDATLAPMK